MPGSRREVKNAREEGVEFLFNRQPLEVVEYFGQACGVKMMRNEWVRPDVDGRRRPEPIAGSEQSTGGRRGHYRLWLPAQIRRPGWEVDVQTNDWEWRVAQRRSGLSSSRPATRRIFAGGDMVRGSDLVVTAIWEGRQAARVFLIIWKCSGVTEENTRQLIDSKRPFPAALLRQPVDRHPSG